MILSHRHDRAHDLYARKASAARPKIDGEYTKGRATLTEDQLHQLMIEDAKSMKQRKYRDCKQNINVDLSAQTLRALTGRMTAKQVGDAIGISAENVRHALGRLKNAGHVTRHEVKFPNSKPVLFWERVTEPDDWDD